MGAIFGPAGNSLSYKKVSKSLSLKSYLGGYGLQAFEFQCGMGVKTSEEAAVKFKNSILDIQISIHAPYYISLSSVDEFKRLRSVDYILQTARLAKQMGAGRIIVHSGSCRNLDRTAALNLAKKTLRRAINELENEHLQEIVICPETMGKINQLGNLEEVLELCKIGENLIPCVDFGHLNARTFGGIRTQFDYEKILNLIENELGFNVLKKFHSHFSKVEYSENGGERRHLTFDDEVFGPCFEPLAELVVKRNLSPVFICESAGTQAEDAAEMKSVYDGFKDLIK